MKRRQINQIIYGACLMQIATHLSAAEFGAYYTRLPIENDDPIHKVGNYPDIVVRLDGDRQFVFSRDSSFLPCLLVGNKRTYVEELVPRKGDGTETRPDRINKYSYVRLIENTPEKVVVHWRYLADFSNVEWDGVVDEYYTIEPQGNVERVVREGTPRREDWDDAATRHVQTFQLTASGIESVQDTPPAKTGAKGRAIQGARVRKSMIGTPVAAFRFDEGLQPNDNRTTESVSGFADCRVGGHQTVWRKGVSGSSLLFDGYYSGVTLPKEQAPVVEDQITVEAWVALGAYPFNWAPIVHQSTWEDRGYYLGVDSYGHLGFMANIGGTWQKIQASTGLFETDIELFRWTHVAASYDGRHMRLYLNGEEVASQTASGKITLPEDRDLVIGLNSDELVPTSPIRTWATYPSIFGVDGLIDEVRVYGTALSAEALQNAFVNFKPASASSRAGNLPAHAAGVRDGKISRPTFELDLEPRDLPANPGGSPAAEFGAQYTNLRFHEGFDNMWRVSDHPDIEVKFDKSPTKVVFWKGLRYAPALVTENGKWAGDQSAETSENWGKELPDDHPESVGCAEHMSDAQARHCHVRIIENTPARVVIHWRYAEIDVRYTLTRDNDGWGAWADEYYTIYPDGVGIRHVARGVGGWQETMFYNAPGTKPEDNVNLAAYTLVNAAGQEQTFEWGQPDLVYPRIPGQLGIKDGPIVSMVNFKANYRPFYIYAEGSGMRTFNVEVRPQFSAFPWWNHYPVSQAISDGRSAERADRMTSSSLVWGHPTKGCLMIGLTDQPAASLVPLALSWDRPAEIVNPQGCTSLGYVQNERAYRLLADQSSLSFDLQASTERPVVNPCFVVRNWGHRGEAEVLLDGRQPKDFRQGTMLDTDGNDCLVVWIEMESTKPVKISISGARSSNQYVLPARLAAEARQRASKKPVVKAKSPESERAPIIASADQLNPEGCRMANDTPNISHGPMLGAVSEDTVRIWVRTSVPADVTCALFEDGIASELRTQEVRTTLASDNTCIIEFDGLKDETEYQYVVRAGKSERQGTFTTLGPSLTQRNVRIVYGYGYNHGENKMKPGTSIFQEMASREADLVLFLGDFPYTARGGREEVRKGSQKLRDIVGFEQLTSSTPTYGIYDDHDFGPNDCDGSHPNAGEALAAFKEQWPNPSYGLPEDKGIYCSFVVGDVEFFLLDGRYPARKAQNTMLGTVQFKWLCDGLKSSESRYKVLVSGTQFGRVKGDSWAGEFYLGERDELFTFIAENDISGVIGISGDVHRSDIYKLPIGKDRYFYDFTPGALSREQRTPPNPLPETMIHSYGDEMDNNMYGEIEFRPAADEDAAIIFRSFSAMNGLIYEHKLTPHDLALKE